MSSKKMRSQLSSKSLKIANFKQKRNGNTYNQLEYRQYIKKLSYKDIIEEMKKWVSEPRQFRFYQKGDPEYVPLTPEERMKEQKESMQDNYNSPLWEFQNIFLEDRQPHPTTALWAVIMHLGDIFRGTVGNWRLQYYPLDKMREAKRDIYYIRLEALREGISRFPAVDKKIEELAKIDPYWTGKKPSWNEGYESRMEVLNELLQKNLITAEELEKGNTILYQKLKEYRNKLDLMIDYTDKFPIWNLKPILAGRTNIQLGALYAIRELTTWVMTLNPKWNDELLKEHIEKAEMIVEDFYQKYYPMLKQQMEYEETNLSKN